MRGCCTALGGRQKGRSGKAGWGWLLLQVGGGVDTAFWQATDRAQAKTRNKQMISERQCTLHACEIARLRERGILFQTPVQETHWQPPERPSHDNPARPNTLLRSLDRRQCQGIETRKRRDHKTVSLFRSIRPDSFTSGPCAAQRIGRGWSGLEHS